MKRLSALLLTISVYLTTALPARAITVDGDLCPNAPGSNGNMNFNPLCYLELSGGIVGNILNIIFIIVVLIALIFLIYGGIKWITSGGDKAGVESARNMIVAALVGLVIAFLAYFILQIVFRLFGLDFSNGSFFGELNLFS
jgi:hypothetical protein